MTPKKSLSQNFLKDQNILNKIVLSAEISEKDSVLEIGPGKGALTKTLLAKNAAVIAVEKDDFLVKDLKAKNLTVFHEDFLKLFLPEILKKGPVKVVSNIPYNISSEICYKLFENSELFSSVTLLVQKEFAEKILSQKHPLGLIANHFFSLKSLFDVPPQAFFPKPKVFSSVIQLIPKNLFIINRYDFMHFIKSAYRQKRKTLINNLKDLFLQEKILHSLKALSLNEKIRPEQMNLESFQKLYLLLKSQ